MFTVGWIDIAMIAALPAITAVILASFRSQRRISALEGGLRAAIGCATVLSIGSLLLMWLIEIADSSPISESGDHYTIVPCSICIGFLAFGTIPAIVAFKMVQIVYSRMQDDDRSPTNNSTGQNDS